MKKPIDPQEKKRLAYERDHYVSAGESRHAFRKNWPKKKAMLNQKKRQRASIALRRLEVLGNFESIEAATIEVTAKQLKQIASKEQTLKEGVMSLREYVQHTQEGREYRAGKASRDRERIEAKYKHLIAALEQDTDSVTSREFLRQIGRTDWDLRRFLQWNPDWKPRLQAKLREIRRSAEYARLKQEKKEAEIRRAKSLQDPVLKSV